MKIKIVEKNKEKIQALIDKAQERAKKRCISVEMIFSYVSFIDMQFSGVPAVKKVGLAYEVDPYAQHYPNAYKFSPESTLFTVEYCKTGWFLTDLHRGYGFKTVTELHALTFPTAAQDALIDTRWRMHHWPG